MTRPLESYQDEIYLTGLTGAVPELPTDLGRLEEAARAVMTPRAFDYVAGAAGSGDTAQENLAAFRRWRIVPRMLTDVSTPSYSTTCSALTSRSPSCWRRSACSASRIRTQSRPSPARPRPPECR